MVENSKLKILNYTSYNRHYKQIQIMKSKIQNSFEFKYLDFCIV